MGTKHKLMVKVEIDNFKLSKLYVDLFFYEQFYSNLNEVLQDLANKDLSRFGLIAGRGSSHIWISDKETSKRLVIITEA